MTPASTPLYSEASHSLARIIAGAVAMFVAAGGVIGARDLTSQATLTSVAAIAGFVALAFGTVRMLTRPQRIFGSAEGLVAKTRRTTRVIPWSEVGDVECPLSSFNPLFRRYYVTVRGETTRIYFFAGSREVERLEQFRATRGIPPNA
jgi:hypothetical protein